MAPRRADAAGEADFWWKWAFEAERLTTHEEVLEVIEELMDEYDSRRDAMGLVCREGKEASMAALVDRLLSLL